MPLATRIAESTVFAGVSPGAGRPLFVPAGIRVVRTGPTTQAELDRLLADADDSEASPEVSGIRIATPAAPRGLFHQLADALGLSSSAR